MVLCVSAVRGFMRLCSYFFKYAPLECQSEIWEIHWQVRVLLIDVNFFILSTPALGYTVSQQELSYHKQIARQLSTQYVESITVTLKSRLRVTQGHWKLNQWLDHTRLTISRVISR